MSASNLDIVLINPNSRKKIYQSLGGSLAAVEPPVWAGLMSSYLRGKGYSTRIIDAEAEELAPSEIAKRVKELNPVLTAIVVYGHQPSASTQNMTGASAAATAIKSSNPDTKLLMVGGHVAALPKETLNTERVDYTCGGEGLVTMAALIDALKGGRSEDLQKVPDLWFWEKAGKAAYSAVSAPLVKDLDAEMPMMDWEQLPMDRYRAHNWHCFGDLQRQPYASIYTTLGCPYHCSFCCIQAPFKSGEKALGMKESSSSYRFWSPNKVLDQIEFLVRKHGVRNLKFADEMFVLNPKHVHGICDGIIERKLDLNIWAYARVDTVKEGMSEKLKRAGVNWLVFGIEAATDRVRANVEKRFQRDEVYKTVAKVRSEGINVLGNYIFGLPEDDQESMQDTLNLALDLNTEFANFYSAMAYPGSSLYRMAVKEGWALPETWSGYSQHSVDTLPLRTRHLSAAEVLKFRDQAFHNYFSDSKYLKMVEQKFGAPTVQHIKEMTQHKLERNLLKSSRIAA
ncbi:MAG: radical SAM protein [Verrucomicrobia bacterium]|nr:radical SAM protein [Verrucomicrobiota bacterium]